MKKNIILTLSLLTLININAQDAYEPNDDFTTSSPISSCTQLNATIDSSTDVDYYEFNSIDNQAIEFRIFGQPTSLTLKATIYDASLTEITNSTTNGAGFLFLTFIPSGISNFYIKIEEINNSFSADSYHFIITNSTCLDTDGDGLLDSDETTTDPFGADTDYDGLFDGSEVIVFATDPLDADTDDDGVYDGLEISNTTNPLFFDSDTDGLSDGLEIGVYAPVSSGTNNGYSYAGTNIAAGNYFPDADSGFTTTNPLIADTDGGGVIDGAEDLNKNGIVDNGETDPLVGGDDILGVNEYNLSSINIYPNPFTDRIIIEQIFNIGELSIYNVLGQNMIKYIDIKNNGKNTEIITTELPNGMYIIKSKTFANKVYKVLGNK